MKSFILVSCYLLFGNSAVISSPVKENFNEYLKHPAVRKFREFLRIDTSQEKNIHLAVDFIRHEAEELGLPFTVYETEGHKPICIITWEGRDPTLKSIMLNVHMDVVPVEAETWKYPPFEAHMDDNGDIYGRGAQDTKDVAIQYLEAIRKLLKANVTLLRTVHVTFMPDEETGGFKGMRQFIDADAFKKLNIGFALDEGFVSDQKNTVYALYQDKRPWQMQFTVHGQGGHGFSLPESSAVDNAYKMMTLIKEYRTQQKAIRDCRNKTDYGAYTSVNVNIIKAGLAMNVIPSKVILGVDMRLSVNSNINDMEKLIKTWMDAAGNDTELTFIRRDDRSDKTAIDHTNPYWTAFERALTNIGLQWTPIVLPATSDMLPLRNRGIPAIGFTTKMDTILRYHDKDEYLNVKIFLKGIDIYLEVIKALANVK